MIAPPAQCCQLAFRLLYIPEDEIIGAIVRNHSATYMGHLHAGIAPWYRGKGYGTLMLQLALEVCKQATMDVVEIVTCKENVGAIRVLEKNGGIAVEEFIKDEIWRLRYRFDLRK